MKKSIATNVTIRRATVNDLGELIELCRAHAAFERARFDRIGLQERLSAALFDHVPRASVFLAEIEQELVGYASCSREFSTWSSVEFLHMDCLFVSEAFRGQGLGSRLIEVVFDEAKRQNITEVQWQTPDWNENAIQFYRSLGATHSMKARFKKMLGWPRSRDFDF